MGEFESTPLGAEISAMVEMNRLLADLAQKGMIADWGQTPGESAFNVEIRDGIWVHLMVRPTVAP